MKKDNRLYTKFIAGTLFPLHEHLKGHNTIAIRERLERSESWPVDKIDRLRLRRLRAFLENIKDEVPYFRSLFRQLDFEPCLLDTLEDIRRLPLLSKELIRSHHEELKSDKSKKLIEQKTSGSSGDPLTFWVDRDRISYDISARWRAMRWWGVDIGDPEIVVWGSPIEVRAQDYLRRLRDKLFRTRLLPIININTNNLDSYLNEIHSRKPVMMFGYPSALVRLAQRAIERSLDMSHIGARVIFVTSEVLKPHWREIIEETFGCPTANEYGARDAGYIASECPYGSMHIAAENILVEILDEKLEPLPFGRVGEVIVTNFASKSFPFIRYRTGDLASLSCKACSCGRGLPVIEKVCGRSNDCLVAEDGSYVHDSALNYIIRGLKGVYLYQIVQEGKKKVRVSVVGSKEFGKEAESIIRDCYRNLLGTNMDIVVEKVDTIHSSASGKFRHVVNNLTDAGS